MVCSWGLAHSARSLARWWLRSPSPMTSTPKRSRLLKYRDALLGASGLDEETDNQDDVDETTTNAVLRRRKQRKVICHSDAEEEDEKKNQATEEATEEEVAADGRAGVDNSEAKELATSSSEPATSPCAVSLSSPAALSSSPAATPVRAPSIAVQQPRPTLSQALPFFSPPTCGHSTAAEPGKSTMSDEQRARMARSRELALQRRAAAAAAQARHSTGSTSASNMWPSTHAGVAQPSPLPPAYAACGAVPPCHVPPHAQYQASSAPQQAPFRPACHTSPQAPPTQMPYTPSRLLPNAGHPMQPQAPQSQVPYAPSRMPANAPLLSSQQAPLHAPSCGSGSGGPAPPAAPYAAVRSHPQASHAASAIPDGVRGAVVANAAALGVAQAGSTTSQQNMVDTCFACGGAGHCALARPKRTASPYGLPTHATPLSCDVLLSNLHTRSSVCAAGARNCPQRYRPPPGATSQPATAQTSGSSLVQPPPAHSPSTQPSAQPQPPAQPVDCPNCRQPCAILTSRTPKNPNRQFHKCVPCNKFVNWCDGA